MDCKEPEPSPLLPNFFLLFWQNPPTQMSEKERHLWTACGSGHLLTVTQLLQDTTINVNLRFGFYASSPLMQACLLKQKAVILLLLQDPRVDINQPNSFGVTPLAVCANGPVEVLRTILNDPRVRAKSKDSIGTTPLLNACAKGHPSSVAVLARDPRIDPNEVMVDGQSAMSLLLEIGNSRGLEELISHCSHLDVDHPVNVDASCRLDLPETWRELLRSQDKPLVTPREIGLAAGFQNTVTLLDEFTRDPLATRYKCWQAIGAQGAQPCRFSKFFTQT